MPLLRAHDRELRIAVQEIAAQLGIPAIEPRRFGFAVTSDDTLSLVDATALIERFTAEADKQRAAWRVYVESCRAWLDGRAEAFRTAADTSYDAALREGKGPGESGGLGRTAGREAARSFELTVPRPAWQGEPGFGNNCPLMYADAAELGAATARSAER
ncbi:hypothetical protein N4G69_20220 [Streptomyces mirabilis]|uniref:hypothetical protein n=1 Tax=Streptomyces mirabilis TaxID=68239 RepID=UPI0021C083B1|nr:hypothetical protein [Streptomyces mirabilis]MCT9107932.1 hypothetical protein [Streptomyces mirabilis]